MSWFSDFLNALFKPAQPPVDPSPAPYPEPVPPVIIADKRKPFFDYVRHNPFPGELTQDQVDGLNRILDYGEEFYPEATPQDLAYILATVFWETAHTMQPIEEFGGSTRRYAPYYGRGLVQITWEANYKRFGELLGMDLVGHPEWVLDWDTSLTILFDGMWFGIFTGKRLGDYFDRADGRDDPFNARRIVNGTDHAEDIAVIYTHFLAALGTDVGKAIA